MAGKADTGFALTVSVQATKCLVPAMMSNGSPTLHTLIERLLGARHTPRGH